MRVTYAATWRCWWCCSERHCCNKKAREVPVNVATTCNAASIGSHDIHKATTDTHDNHWARLGSQRHHTRWSHPRILLLHQLNTYFFIYYFSLTERRDRSCCIWPFISCRAFAWTASAPRLGSCIPTRCHIELHGVVRSEPAKLYAYIESCILFTPFWFDLHALLARHVRPWPWLHLSPATIQPPAASPSLAWFDPPWRASPP